MVTWVGKLQKLTPICFFALFTVFAFFVLIQNHLTYSHAKHLEEGIVLKSLVSSDVASKVLPSPIPTIPFSLVSVKDNHQVLWGRIIWIFHICTNAMTPNRQSLSHFV